MRQKNIKVWALAGLLGCAINSSAQVFQTSNYITGLLPYVGCDANSTQPLRVKTEANYNIDWYTGAVQRMRLGKKNTTAINGLNVPTDGFLLLSGEPDAFANASSKAPFSRLHLVDNTGTTDPNVYAQQYGYRSWMRNGITFTGNSDQAYVGQKYYDNDHTDLVFQWSDNAGTQPEYGPDRLRFLFTSSLTGTSSGAASSNGLEAMRMWPVDQDNVNIGIGDFSVLNTDPTERLHLLTGRLRLEQLPDDPIAPPTLLKFLVVDDTDPSSPEYGVIKWRNVPPGTGGACSSGWTLNGNNAVTAYNGNPCIPQMPDRVGIGVSAPTAKLHVQSAVLGTGGSYTTMQVDNLTPTVDNNGTDYVGLRVQTVDLLMPPNPNAVNYYGGRFWASNGTRWNIGVDGIGETTGSFNSLTNIGVRGTANHTPGPSGTAYGVQGISTNGVAGYFQNFSQGGIGLLVDGRTFLNGDLHVSGPGWINGGTVIMSDENLKQDINPLEGALDLIGQLQPKTYFYDNVDYGYLGLPDGQCMGLLAQDAEEVLPSIVHSTVWPEVRDTLGTIIHPELPVKGIDYTSLVPLLISGMQEQQATIAGLQALVADMQQQIAACCASQGQGMAPNTGDQKSTPAEELKEQRLLIIPNPVADLTTLRYYVPQAGQVNLQVSSADGKPLSTLREEQAEAGEFSYAWNTTKLAAGTYFCTLMVDGNVVVKRAVKVK